MSNIKLKEEQYKAAVTEIQNYFINERDESIGVLQARLLLDFFMETVGPAIYNSAVADMQKFLYDRIDDMYEFER